ncbi:uncharacterized protein LOC110347883 [Heterocephalus glaber]|uniref:Uncharacterized protein LOC110347883 n=1 Tax=Heterocephalus glaber TaxID=10181 RepID=A0AAX6SKS6_HETGA|nr:uncharacterized protein LOC110347883 [Heterocephalus glaber]
MVFKHEEMGAQKAFEINHKSPRTAPSEVRLVGGLKTWVLVPPWSTYVTLGESSTLPLAINTTKVRRSITHAARPLPARNRIKKLEKDAQQHQPRGFGPRVVPLQQALPPGISGQLPGHSASRARSGGREGGGRGATILLGGDTEALLGPATGAPPCLCRPTPPRLRSGRQSGPGRRTPPRAGAQNLSSTSFRGSFLCEDEHKTVGVPRQDMFSQINKLMESPA